MTTDKYITTSLTPGYAPEMDGLPGNAGMKQGDTGDKKITESGEANAQGEKAGESDTSGVQGKIADMVEDNRAVMGYDMQIKTLLDAAEASRPETEEQRKKRERRERAKKTIAGLSDGLSALSNLYFTTQYAPNAYNPQNSQLGKVNEHIEKMKAERKADADRYNNLMLRLGDAQNARARTLRELQAQHEAQKIARQKAEQEAKRFAWEAALQPDKQREQKGKGDKAVSEAEEAAVKAKYAPQMQKAKLNTEQARAGAQRASASASYASAAAHNRSNPNEFSAWDENGNEHKFRTKEAADRFAKQHGTWQEEDITSSTTTDRNDEVNGHSSQIATTTQKGGRPVKPQPKDNTPPSRRGNKDNVPPSRRK